MIYQIFSIDMGRTLLGRENVFISETGHLNGGDKKLINNICRWTGSFFGPV